MESFLENIKNRIVAALFSRQTEEFKGLIEQAIAKAQAPELGETDEKYLRQVLAALVRHKDQVNRSTHLKKQTLNLKTLLADKVRRAAPNLIGYQAWEERLDIAPWQQPFIFSEAITFQMTSGCSNFCRRCNEWALPKVRSHFSFDAVNTFIDKFLAYGNRDLALYGGSDPLDWCDGAYDITHVLNRFGTTSQFSLLTKVPKAKGHLAKQLMKMGVPMSVSLTDRNRDRITALEKQMGQSFTKQHATSDLLIPAGLDEDFSTVKPSITDSYGTEISPDGCFIIIPAFTSALHPFGHKKIRITSETNFIPKKKIGRPALLVDYFKPLEVVSEQGLSILPALLDVQVENILCDDGRDELTPPGMRSIREYFDVFSDKARLKRKKLTPTVVKHIKNRYLQTTSFQKLCTEDKSAMKNEILDHVRFTRKQVVLQARTCAVSFFLAAIHSYIRAQPIKCRIIRWLTRQEYMQFSKAFSTPTLPIVEQLSHPDTDPWLLFRYHALTLVHLGSTKPVEQFIQTCPAIFHPDKDRFVSQNSYS